MPAHKNVKASSITPIEWARKSSRSLMGHREEADLFFKDEITDLPYSALRGIFDRRAMGLALLKQETLAQSPPGTEKARAAWLAFMDVYGDLRGKWANMNGAIANAQSARASVLDRNGEMTGYDREASIIAFDFMRKGDSSFGHTFPEIDEQLTAAVVEQAKNRSVFHMILSDRLQRDGDLLNMVMDDPDAFAHRVSLLMQKELSDEETALITTAVFEHGIGLDKITSTGFVSPKVLFEKENEIKNLQQEIEIKSHKKQKADTLEDIYINNIHGSMNRKERQAVRKRARKKISKEINQLRARKNALFKEFNELKKIEANHDRELKKIHAMFNTETTQSDGTYARHSVTDFSYYKINPSVQDIISKARNLITAEQSAAVLDGLYKDYGEDLRLANSVGRKLRSHLMAPREMRLERELHEGILNPSALLTLISDPFYDTPYMHRHERYGQDLDTTVTILIDNSGSMTEDSKIALAYIASERLSYWLSNAGIPTEILGFTTALSAPLEEQHKGRTSQLHHIIYKSREEQHALRTTNEMAAMLLNSIHQSNIDGEAVAWAHNRLLKATNKRKILMVLSDGKPAGGYNAESMPNVLQRHLRDTVRWIEDNSTVEIIGIGIKTDVGKYYSNAITLRSPYQLIETIAEKLKHAIDNPRESDFYLRRKEKMAPTPKTLG